jgi:putative transposase
MLAFIGAENASFPVEFICNRLGVFRAGDYAWRARQANPTARMVDDVELIATSRQFDAVTRGTYGVPRVTAELQLGLGQPVNRKRVARLMASAGLQGLTRRTGWRRAKPARPRSRTTSRPARSDPTGPMSCESRTAPSIPLGRAGSTARS